MLLSLSGYNVQAEQACIQMVKQNKVDGIIGLTYSPDIQIPDNIPFVSIDRYFGPNIPCITSDNFNGGQLAAQKLMELGCQRTAFFRKGSTVQAEVDKRGLGFEEYCRIHNLSCTSLRCNDEEEYQPFEDFIDEHIVDGVFEFDGIFCNTDMLAAHVIRMLCSRKLRVPEDVQVLGFDGTRMVGFHRYYCSTIVQPVELMAEAAVNMLFDESRTSLSPLICLPVHYACGGSTRDGGELWPANI